MSWVPAKKTIIVLIIAFCLTLSLAGYAFAAGFSDVQGHWAEDQINQWAEKGLAGGYADGTFKPNKEVTRAEFVALVNRAFGIESPGATAGFTDVKPGRWYYEAVAAARAAGYAGGYADGTFRPNQTITRQEVAGMLVRLLQLEPAAGSLDRLKDAGRIQDWARGNVGAVVQNGLMRGMPDGNFMPAKSITRAEAVVSLDRALAFKTSETVATEKPQPVEQSAVEGTVTLNAKAVENATVKVFAAGGYEVLKTAATNNSGYFKVDLDPGKYDITAVTEREVAYKSDVEIKKNQVTAADLSLQQAAVLSGVIKDKNGEPVKNATVLFTTNPTFIAKTNDKGEYTIPVLPDRSYKVRAYEPDKEDAEPVEVAGSISAGAAGEQNVGEIKTPFAVDTTPVGGGGGGAPAGGTPEPAGPPVINSVTFTVSGQSETVTGNNNVFTVDLRGYDNNDVFTSITVNASENADKAEVSLLGRTRTMSFHEGVASSSVSEILGGMAGGESGISMKTLKGILELINMKEFYITVTGNNETRTTVTVKLII